MKKEGHLSDAEIQQYVSGEAFANKDVSSHIAQCAHCSGSVELYREMAVLIAKTAKPTFDFELAPAVLARLPAPKNRRVPVLAFVMGVAISGILACAFIFYYLNVKLPHGVEKYGGTAAYCFLAICGLLFTFLTANLSWVHLRKIHKLNALATLQQNLHGAV